MTEESREIIVGRAVRELITHAVSAWSNDEMLGKAALALMHALSMDVLRDA